MCVVAIGRYERYNLGVWLYKESAMFWSKILAGGNIFYDKYKKRLRKVLTLVMGVGNVGILSK